MPLTIKALLGKVFVDGMTATEGQEVAFANCLSIGSSSSVCIYDGSALAATLADSTTPESVLALRGTFAVRNGSSRLTTYTPPTNNVNPLYYRRSYRKQVYTPGGSVGILV